MSTSGGSPTVVVIEDDQSVREALRGLFESVGLTTQTKVGWTFRRRSQRARRLDPWCSSARTSMCPWRFVP
jgi:hypothetical protein